MSDGARADAPVDPSVDTLAEAFIAQTCRLVVARQWIDALVREKGALHRRCARQQEQIRELMQVVDDGE